MGMMTCQSRHVKSQSLACLTGRYLVSQIVVTVADDYPVLSNRVKFGTSEMFGFEHPGFAAKRAQK
jgi:hypothetical protein